MRAIEIREKLAPYSSVPGIRCWVPCSDWEIVVSSDQLEVVGGEKIPLNMSGPVSQFLVQMDLERNCLRISGLTSMSRYRAELMAQPEGLFLTVRGGERQLIAKGGRVHAPVACERLSFGSWKAQDWSLLAKRRDPKELLPLLFLLGQKSPVDSGIVGSPEPEDGYLGFRPANVAASYRMIREHLIQETGDVVRVLPKIHDYPVGRARLHASIGLCHIEWTQGKIRQMIVEPMRSGEVRFEFPGASSCRVGRSRINNGVCLPLERGQSILFDQFRD